jgi:hypothetical protein
MRAMGAAEIRSVGFDTVANDRYAAMLALRRERFDRAFKTVKRMRLPVKSDLQRLVVIISANFAFWHNKNPFLLTLIVNGGTGTVGENPAGTWGFQVAKL